MSSSTTHKQSTTLVPIDPRTGGYGAGTTLQPGVSGTGQHTTRSGTVVIRPDTLHAHDPSGNLRGALWGLAVGCLHLMVDRALTDFPTTCVAAPSRYVVVELAFHGPITEAYRAYFPFKERWDRWQGAVVPMLKDPANQPAHNHVIADLIQRKQYEDVILIYQDDLQRRFRANGWLPTADQQELIEETVPDPPPVPTADPVDAVPLPRIVKVGRAPVVEE